MLNARKRWGRWALWIGGLALAMAVLSEFGLRWTVGLGHPVLYSLDADCGYLPTPDQNVHRFGAHIEINSFGMRSAPLLATKPDGEFRLLVTGDSVAFSTRMDQSQLFATRLNELLPQQLHRPVEVLNISAGGWAVPNEAGYLHSRGLFAADAVMVVVNSGDLIQPFNVLRPGDELNYPQHSPPLALVELWRRYLAPHLFHTSIPPDAGSTVASATDLNSAMQPMLGGLEQIDQLCHSANTRMIVVFYPARFNDSATVDYHAGFERLRQWATDHNRPFWDLTAVMASRPDGELYLDAIHPNPAGHAAIASYLAQQLTEFLRGDTTTQPVRSAN